MYGNDKLDEKGKGLWFKQYSYEKKTSSMKE